VVRDRTGTAQPVVVVSAIGGVTDQLVELADELSDQPKVARQQIGRIRNLHRDVLHRLAGDAYDKRNRYLEDLFDELAQVFFNEKQKKENPDKWKDHILSFGERASAHIFASALCCN